MTSTLAPATTLETLAEAINAEHRVIETAMHTAVDHARNAGRLLIEAKAALPHGAWLPWLAEHFEGSERNAQGYMRLARQLPELDDAKAQRVADLPLREALRELAEPRDSPALDRRAAEELTEALGLAFRRMWELFEAVDHLDELKAAAEAWELSIWQDTSTTRQIDAGLRSAIALQRRELDNLRAAYDRAETAYWELARRYCPDANPDDIPIPSEVLAIIDDCTRRRAWREVWPRLLPQVETWVA